MRIFDLVPNLATLLNDEKLNPIERYIIANALVQANTEFHLGANVEKLIQFLPEMKQLAALGAIKLITKDSYKNLLSKGMKDQ